MGSKYSRFRVPSKRETKMSGFERRPANDKRFKRGVRGVEGRSCDESSRRLVPRYLHFLNKTNGTSFSSVG